jgi:hypothetical protein
MNAPKRRKQTYETSEFALMLGRMLRAYGRRVGGSDVEDLREMFELQAAFADAVQSAVTAQRAELGRSWADIAEASGTTRQAAQMRYGKTPRQP